MNDPWRVTETSPSTTAGRLRPHDVAQGVFWSAVFGAVLAFVTRRFRLGLRFGAVAIGADVVSRLLSRRYPSPFPARLRPILVHPAGERRALREAVDPKPGERILEIGPGGGHHAVEIAPYLLPEGRLDVLDVQPEMLRVTEERARRAGVDNIVATVGNACDQLPFEDATFDAVYMSGVLGELPDPQGALRELRRVLNDKGRLLVGEAIPDPDFVRLSRLRRMAEATGYGFHDRIGTPLLYIARFDTDAIPTRT
jgi:SAM-dependent methyltransferase